MTGRSLLAILLALALAGCATASQPTALAPGAHYVAMGSSFAAGPGVATVAADTPARCSRSTENYAQQLARRLQLRLTDVSCGGATTAHITGAWNELPPQIDALTAETALVTITIGGNDVGYIGRLMRASCAGAAPERAPAFCRSTTARMPQLADSVSETEWQSLAASLDQITTEVRRRSPVARLVFVDYLTVLPDGEMCAVTPLAADTGSEARAVAVRLSAETAAAARRTGGEILRASALSANHSACSEQPWMTGFVASAGAVAPHVPYHPSLSGMTAVANALAALLSRR
jgi:lysophospholipase L1-like esterase